MFFFLFLFIVLLCFEFCAEFTPAAIVLLIVLVVSSVDAVSGVGVADGINVADGIGVVGVIAGLVLAEQPLAHGLRSFGPNGGWSCERLLDVRARIIPQAFPNQVNTAAEPKRG